MAVLRVGVAVTVYEARSVGGETWYRIGENRWVVGQWVRLLDVAQSVATTVMMAEVTLPMCLPAGWVVTTTLNVPPRGPAWRLTTRRWASSCITKPYRSWMNGRCRACVGSVLPRGNGSRAETSVWRTSSPRPAGIGAAERWVGVCLAEQTAIAYEGIGRSMRR